MSTYHDGKLNITHTLLYSIKYTGISMYLKSAGKYSIQAVTIFYLHADKKKKFK